ncbi:hypothetical protein KJA15_03550 [Patescibacteria group bacterium]|nr:hypothetical protein [Patescibacteria group bacterium]
MEEKKQKFIDIFEKIDGRSKSISEMIDKSESEIPRAIYYLTVEICELEKLILLLLWKP